MFGTLSIAELILRAVTFLIAMAVHEYAHSYIAYRMGDTTAKDLGRMTLDPRANIDIYGFFMAIVIGFGFLGSAPVDEYRMRDRRWGMFWAVAAGPISSFLLAVLFSIPFWFGMQPSVPGPRAFVPSLTDFITRMVVLNVYLSLFNLIPLAPLDGWTMMLKLLPPSTAQMIGQYRRESSYIFFGLIIISFLLPQFNLLGIILGPPAALLLHVLRVI